MLLLRQTQRRHLFSAGFAHVRARTCCLLDVFVAFETDTRLYYGDIHLLYHTDTIRMELLLFKEK